MAQKPETIFKERVLKDLRALPSTYAVKIQQQAIRGTPDILACVNGWFVAIELKKDDKAKTDKRQDYELKKIDEAGGMALVAHPLNWPGMLARIKRLAVLSPPDGDRI
jgi:hypothetical protein